MLIVCTSNIDHRNGEPHPYIHVGWVYEYQELSKNKDGISHGRVMLRRLKSNLNMLAIGVGDEVVCHFSKLKFKFVGKRK